MFSVGAMNLMGNSYVVTYWFYNDGRIAFSVFSVKTFWNQRLCRSHSHHHNLTLTYVHIFSCHMFFFVIFMENDSKARGQRLIFNDLSN